MAGPQCPKESTRECSWPVCLKSQAMSAAWTASAAKTWGKWHWVWGWEVQWSEPLAIPVQLLPLTSGSPNSNSSRRVGWSEAGGCRFQPHCLSCSHSACPPHEDRGKEGTRLKHCLRRWLFFKELVTISVQQELHQIFK